MKLNQRSGFTLLEIIIVIIILGVIAGLALPKLAGNIECSRGMEALNLFPAIRGSIDRCIVKNSNTSLTVPVTCNTFANLDITDPGTETTSSFAYAIAQTAGFSYTITAGRRPGAATSANTNRIVLTVTKDATSGNTTSTAKAGFGNFLGI